MSANVDAERAIALLAEVEPELAAEEAAAHAEGAALDDARLDRALRAGLARLRIEVGRETFIYLQWKAEQVRDAARAARAAAVEARRVARATRDAAAALRVPPPPARGTGLTGPGGAEIPPTR